MKIFIKAKPAAKETCVEQIDETHFSISVKEPPRNGLANQAIVRALADHFNVSPSAVRMIAGFSSKQKIFDVQNI